MQNSTIEQGYNPFLLPSHPGENVADSDYRRITRRLESYIPFVNIKGMTGEEAILMDHYLPEIFAYSRDEWEPTNCHMCAWRIFKLFTTKTLHVPEGYKAAMIYADIDHSWFAFINEQTNKSLVFDPTGLDRVDVFEAQPKRYIPFFGVAEYAPFPLNNVYLGSFNYRVVTTDNASSKAMYTRSTMDTHTRADDTFKPIMSFRM